MLGILIAGLKLPNDWAIFMVGKRNHNNHNNNRKANYNYNNWSHSNNIEKNNNDNLRRVRQLINFCAILIARIMVSNCAAQHHHSGSQLLLILMLLLCGQTLCLHYLN